MIDILYEDDYICICNKPVGMSSEKSNSSDSLAYELSNQLGSEVFPIHRLDKAVGGAIMYAKTKNAAALFSCLFSENKANKEYIAVLDGVPAEKSGILTDLLFKDSKKNKSYIVKRMRKGVKEAKLEYTVKETCENHALVSVKLFTGRTHQIRVQFAGRKTAVTGDGKYGSRDNQCSVALISHKISFIHPVTKKQISVTCPVDTDAYPWRLFKKENIN